MKRLLVSAMMLVSFSFSAAAQLADSPRSCAPARPDYFLDLPSLFEQENIQFVSGYSSDYQLRQFAAEYLKFPASLRRELVRAGATINLLQGQGVTEDPTWNENHKFSLSGRSWDYVPGSGGYAWAKVPTRIVVNNMYNRDGSHGHGSVNLVLHEHGHTLDTIFKNTRLSKLRKWKGILAKEPGATEFLRMLCSQDYCVNNPEEGFAELFAYYHACGSSRQHLEERLPTVAQFFKNFTSVSQLRSSGLRRLFR